MSSQPSSPTRLPSVAGGTRSSDAGVFLREFVRAPLRTASVVPSSPALARRMIVPLLLSSQAPELPVVVELGPGTGSFTAALRAAVPEMRYLGVELNEAMADHLSSRFPGIDLLRGPASSLSRALAERGLPAVDPVISGLPWQAFREPGTHRAVLQHRCPPRPVGGVHPVHLQLTPLGATRPPTAPGAPAVLRPCRRVRDGVAEPAPGRRLHRDRALDERRSHHG